MSHKQAVTHGGQTLNFYSGLVHQIQANTETLMADLLTDLMHLADEQQIDFSTILARAKKYFDAEWRGYTLPGARP